LPAFSYRAVHASGRVQRGEMTAANENELARFLDESGLELIEARPCAERRRFLPAAFKPGQRISLRERALFCRQTSDMLRVGLPFVQSLLAVAESLPPGRWRSVIEDIARRVSYGNAITAAFAMHPGLFNHVFTAILHAGETGGDLVSTFERLGRHLEWLACLGGRTRRVLRYPLFLLCVALGVTAFMMTAVVPQVMEFLESAAVEPPPITRLLIGASRLFSRWWWAAPPAVCVSFAAIAVLRRHSAAFALRCDGWLLSVPWLGSLVRKISTARFAHSLALVLQSGADFPSALRAARGSLGNLALTRAAAEAERQVLSGQPLSLATSRLFPPEVIHMIRAGEQSGRILETLDEAARYYDTETQAAVEAFISALEPVLTIMVGALLAWVALAVLGPVYGSLNALNAGY